VGRVSEQERIEAFNPAALVRLVETLQQRVADLERQNAELRAEVERLKRRQQRQAAPFSKDIHVAQPKRPGRKPGQGRFASRPAPPPQIVSEPPVPVPVLASACPRCGGVLGAPETELASLTDLPEQPQPVVRQYAVGVRRCQSCGRSVRGRHPDLAANQYGATAHRLGPRLLAAAQSLHYQHGVPVRRVPALLAELTGVHLTQSALTQDALRQAAGPVGTAYQALRADIGKAARVHTDDTGWRVGGMPAQLMGFTTDTATVYQIRDRHRNQEVREVIPAHYVGVLCSDRGKSYDAKALAGVKQQKCLAHLQRSVSELLETKWGRGRSFGLGLRRLFDEALALWQSYHADTATDFAAQGTNLRQRLDEHLRERALPDPDNQRLLNGLRWHHQRGNLLRFLDDPRIEPTNNRAERALRPAVIARKVSQCSKTRDGADAFAAFTSVLRTAVQQGASGTERLAQLRRSPLAAGR
jgi:transposase